MTATRRSVLAGAPAAAAGLLGACAATGPAVSEMGGRIPPVPAGMGRVWFFREKKPFFAGDSPARPPILLDGREVGRAVPNGAFFRDVPPGDHRLAIPDFLTARRLAFTVAAGEERYVVAYATPLPPSSTYQHWQVAAALVDPELGRSAVATKVLTDGFRSPGPVR